MRKEKGPKTAVLSDCRNFPLIQEIGVAESNGVVIFVAGNCRISEIAVSGHAQYNVAKNYLKRCQIAKLSISL